MTGNKKAGRAFAHAELKDAGLRVVNGRLVGPTLADPAVKKRLAASKSALREDPAKLRQEYVARGVLTKSGKLTKAYGG